MDNSEDIAGGGRVTRARRKRLASIESDVSSRPGTPMSPHPSKLHPIVEIEALSLPKRTTRRNSITNTPKKTPSKNIVANDLDTPSRRTRRRTISTSQDDNLSHPQVPMKSSALKSLIEEESDKKGMTTKLPIVKIKKLQVFDPNTDSDVEVVNLIDTDQDTFDSFDTMEKYSSPKKQNKSISPIKQKDYENQETSNPIEEAAPTGLSPNVALNQSADSVSATKIANGTNKSSTTPIKRVSLKYEELVSQDSETPKKENVIGETTTPLMPSNSKFNDSLAATTTTENINQSDSNDNVEQNKSSHSKSITFEMTEITEELPKKMYPTTPAAKYSQSRLTAYMVGKKDLSNNEDSMMEVDNNDSYEELEEHSTSTKASSGGVGNNTSICSPSNKSQCATPVATDSGVPQNSIENSTTPSPDKFLRSGKSYGESPTNNSPKKRNSKSNEEVDVDVQKDESTKNIIDSPLKSTTEAVNKKRYKRIVNATESDEERITIEESGANAEDNALQIEETVVVGNSTENGKESIIEPVQNNEDMRPMGTLWADKSVSVIESPDNKSKEESSRYDDADIKEKNNSDNLSIHSNNISNDSDRHKKSPQLKIEETKNRPNDSRKEKLSFSKSWTQSVTNKSDKIDTIEKSDDGELQLATNNEETHIDFKNNKSPLFKLQLAEQSSDSDDDDEEEDENEKDRDREREYFLDTKAKCIDEYQSGDSMSENEKEDYAENDIHEDGESIGSEDTSDGEHNEISADNDSFIVPTDEEDNELLDYSNDDEHCSSMAEGAKKKTFKRLKNMESESDEEAAEEHNDRSEEKALKLEVTRMIDDTIEDENSSDNEADGGNKEFESNEVEQHNANEDESNVESTQSPRKNLHQTTIIESQQSPTVNKPIKSKSYEAQSTHDINDDSRLSSSSMSRNKCRRSQPVSTEGKSVRNYHRLSVPESRNQMEFGGEENEVDFNKSKTLATSEKQRRSNSIVKSPKQQTPNKSSNEEKTRQQQMENAEEDLNNMSPTSTTGEKKWSSKNFGSIVEISQTFKNIIHKQKTETGIESEEDVSDNETESDTDGSSKQETVIAFKTDKKSPKNRNKQFNGEEDSENLRDKSISNNETSENTEEEDTSENEDPDKVITQRSANESGDTNNDVNKSTMQRRMESLAESPTDYTAKESSMANVNSDDEADSENESIGSEKLDVDVSMHQGYNSKGIKSDLKINDSKKKRCRSLLSLPEERPDGRNSSRCHSMSHCKDNKEISKSFIEMVKEKKSQHLQMLKPNKRKLSVSFSDSVRAGPVGTKDLSMECHISKKAKIYLNENEMEEAGPSTSSTPFATKKINKNKRDKNSSVDRILNRCEEILEDKLAIKMEKKKQNRTSKNKKRKSQTSTDEMESSSSGEENKRFAAIRKAMKASADILAETTGKKHSNKQQRTKNKSDSKRLPMEVLTAVGSTLDSRISNVTKKRKRDDTNDHNLCTSNVLKTHSGTDNIKQTAPNPPTKKSKPIAILKHVTGDVYVEPLSPLPKKGKTKPLEILKLPTGDVYVEPLSPKREKVNKAGFRESPITPRTTSWSQHLDIKKDTALLSREEQRKRKKKTKIIEPTNTVPSSTWTKNAGVFKIEKVQHDPQSVHLVGRTIGTEFGVVSLGNSHIKRTGKAQKQASSSKQHIALSAAERALNFRENAIYGDSKRREETRNLLRRKKFVH